MSIYFWGTSVYFWGVSGFLEFLFLLLGGFGTPWVGGPVGVFENTLVFFCTGLDRQSRQTNGPLGKTEMATAIWPLENGPKTINKKHPIVFAFFRLFSLVFDRFCTFWLVFTLLGCLFLTVFGRPFRIFSHHSPAAIKRLPFIGRCPSTALRVALGRAFI